MTSFAIALACVSPVAASTWAYHKYAHGVHEELLVVAFLWGMVGACVAAYVNNRMESRGYCLYKSAGVVEEIIKYFMVGIICSEQGNGTVKPVVYGLFFGAGFALIENVEYSLLVPTRVTVYRSGTVVIFHIITGGLNGVGLAYNGWTGLGYLGMCITWHVVHNLIARDASSVLVDIVAKAAITLFLANGLVTEVYFLEK